MSRTIRPVCSRGNPQTPENRIYFPSCPSGRCRLCYEDSVMFGHERERERRQRDERTTR